MSPAKRQPSRLETLISIVILLVLVAIAAGVFLKQHGYHSPAISLGGGGGETAAKNLFETLPEGISPTGRLERFSAETLYEKIDGKAETYLPSGFEELRCQRFSRAGSDAWVEMFVYDMGHPRNAYAVYSVQKRADADRIGLGEAGYRTPNAIYFVRGRYYIELVSSTVSTDATLAMVALAKQFVAQTTSSGMEFNVPGWFPPEAMAAEGVSLIAGSAFGCEQLNVVFVAGYDLNGKSAVAFISSRKDKRDAAATADAYRKFLIDSGGEAVDPPQDIPNARMVEFHGTYEIFFTIGDVLAGVRDCDDRSAATALARKLLASLKEARP